MGMMLVLMMCPAGIGVALVRRYAGAAPAGQAARGDVPERLLRWAAGLLSAQREEWGQAMVGELAHVDGRGRRWRFAVGCAIGALLLPPWGAAAAAVWAMTVVAAGAAGVSAAVALRYRLVAGEWVFAVVALAFLAGYTLAAATLLRRPRIALPGLLGGLFVVLAWLTLSGFTFYDVVAPRTAKWSPLIALVALPALLGVAGTLWSGSTATGRRAARLAGIGAGLGLYLYATVAVAVLGAGGPPGTPGWTVSENLSDRLANNVILDLVVIPVVTATIGWAGAAVTGRLRPRLVAGAVPVPFTGAGSAGEAVRHPVRAPYEAAPAVLASTWRRTAWLLLLCAGVAAAVFLAAASGLRG